MFTIINLRITLRRFASRINERLFNWETCQSQSTIRFNLGSFYVGLQARLKIGTHLLSNRSPDGIRTLTVPRLYCRCFPLLFHFIFAVFYKISGKRLVGELSVWELSVGELLSGEIYAGEMSGYHLKRKVDRQMFICSQIQLLTIEVIHILT